MGVLSDLTVRVGANLTEFKAGMAEVHARTAEASNGFSFMGAAAMAGGALVVGAAVGIGLGLVKATESAADFQRQMNMIQTQAGASATEVSNMSKAILSLAGPTATAPQVLAEAMYHIESTGMRGATALDALRIAAEGAKVGNANLVDVTNALDGVLVTGMVKAGDMASAMGQLNAIVGAGDMTMQNLADAMGGPMIPAAVNLGLSLKDVGAALAVFGDMNIRGAEAATETRMAIMSLGTQTSTSERELAKIGITSDQLGKDMRSGGLIKALEDLKGHLEASGLSATQQSDILVAAFGKKSIGPLLTLLEQTDRLKQKMDAIGKGGATFGDSWSKTTGNLSFKMDALQSAIGAAGIKLGTDLLPYVGRFLDKVTPLVPLVADWADKTLKSLVPGISGLYDNIKNLDPYMKWVVDHWGLIAGFVGAWAAQQLILNVQLAISQGLAIWGMIAPYIKLLGAARSATELWTAAQLLLDAALDANPIGIITLAIAALVVGVIWAYQNVGWFRDVVNQLGAAAKLCASMFWTDVKPALDWFGDKIQQIIGWASNAAGVIKSLFGQTSSVMSGGNFGHPGRAGGGSVTGGSTYLVGERGPELFTAAASGTIIPNHALGGGVGGTRVTEIHVHIDQGAYIDGPAIDMLTNKIAHRLAYATGL